MNLIGIVFLMGMVLGGADKPASEAVFPYPIEVHDFKNGLRLVGVRFDSPGLVAYHTVVRVGSRQEVDRGKSGFTHFFEHMMFRGTEAFPEDEYNEVLQSIGADSNAYTSFDRTVYHILASSASLPRIVEIEADRFQNLKYEKAQFQKEAGAVLGEYNKSAANPFMGLFEKLHATAYKKHPYQHMVIGFLEDIKGMPLLYEYSLQFFDRFYRPEYVTLLVVGDYKWEKLLKEVEFRYKDWNRGSYVPNIPTEPLQTVPREASVAWPSPTLPTMAIAFRAPAFNTDEIDMPGLDVLSQVYFSTTSNIYQELVLKKQWVDFIEAGATDQFDSSLFTILTRVRKPEKFSEVRELLLTEIQRASSELVDEKKLEATKTHMKYKFLMSLDTANSVANTMAHYLSLTNDPTTLNKVYELYSSVTAEDIRLLARRYFQEQNRTVVTLTESSEEFHE